MKIKTKNLPYEEVMALPRPKHRNPLKPLFLLQLVVRVLAILDLLPTKFTYKTYGMEKIGKKEPCLILMNHSSFIDLKIASRIFRSIKLEWFIKIRQGSFLPIFSIP